VATGYNNMRAVIFFLLMLGTVAASSGRTHALETENRNLRVPILLYHQVEPVAVNDMIVSVTSFKSQLAYLKDNGYTVIPLLELVQYLRGQGPMPPAKSVVIAIDDGRSSVYTQMFQSIKEYRLPVTLFIYPSAISNAAYAMTWGQLKELKDSGLFDIQSHTYWHPNFMKERKKLTRQAYLDFVEHQLVSSRKILTQKFGGQVNMLAWPFGLHDDELEQQAAAAGYIAAFTIDRRPVTTSEHIMALPRYIVTNQSVGPAFARFLNDATAPRSQRDSR
jgi:peptidoglycan/xylan/chitin deacetylase (PgdA/CDA1 family)